MGLLGNDELRLAFQLHAVDLVVQADHVTTDAEAAFRERLFPVPLLEELNFVDEAGRRTDRFQEAAVRSLDVLPGTLSLPEKLELLHNVFDAAVVDEAFRLGEGSVVLMTARLLGLTDDEVEAFLGQRREARGVTVEMLDDEG